MSLDFGDADITVRGDWFNSGTADLVDATVEMDRERGFSLFPDPQRITGNSSTTFGRLIVSGFDGVTLERNTQVQGCLVLDGGPLITGPSLLRTPTFCVIRRDGYIDGNQVVQSSSDFFGMRFDVGSDGRYAPIELEGLSSGRSVLATTDSGDHASLASSGIDTSKSINRYWRVQLLSGPPPSDTSARFNFEADDADAGVNPSAFVVRRHDGGAWHPTATGSRTLSSTEATGLTAFGDFAVGEPDLPMAPSAPDLAASSDTGSCNADNITKDDTPTFIGTGENGSNVSLFVDGSLAGTALVSSGMYSITTSDVDDGAHSVRASATNDEGSSEKTEALSVLIDTSAPSAPAGLSSDPRSPANVNNPVIKGHAEAGSEVVLMDDPCPIEPVASGTATAFRTDGFGVTVADSSTTHFTAISTDKAGNSSECSAPFTYVEDSTIPPRLSIDDVRVVEGTGPDADMIFTLELEWPGSVTSTVKAATKVTGKGAGHADKADFRKASAKIVFAPGEVSKTFVVKLIGDVANEPDETLSVLLKSAKNATIADGKGVGTIQDDDD